MKTYLFSKPARADFSDTRKVSLTVQAKSLWRAWLIAGFSWRYDGVME